jgi:hypothetical protein
MLGEKMRRGEDYRTPRAVKVRTKQICSYCTNNINKGEVAVICYTLEDNFNPFSAKQGIQQKQYLHEKCVEKFSNAIKNGESNSLEIL